MPTPANPPVILLTGRPGVGKTTVIRNLVSLLGDSAGGFYTRELRGKGKRTGFQIVTLAGQTAYLATKDPAITFAAQAPFGRYRVNLHGLDTVAVPALDLALARDQVIIIDEIGPMEIISDRFCRTVLAILDSHAVVVGTIAQRANIFTGQVRSHPRVMVRTVTVANRAEMAVQVYAELTRYLVDRSIGIG